MISCPLSIVTNERELDDAVNAISGSASLGVDTETTALDPFRARIRLLQIATPSRSFVFDLFEHNALRDARIRALLESPSTIKIFHNAKFDLKMLLHHCGIEVRGIFDTLL